MVNFLPSFWTILMQMRRRKKGIIWGWEWDIINTEAITCLASSSALNKRMFPNGHLTSAWLQLCSGFQSGCAGHSPGVVLKTHIPWSFPIPCLEMHPWDDQNEGFPITWHEWTPKILVMGETLLHNKIYTHPITSSQYQCKFSSYEQTRTYHRTRGACVLGT